MTDPWTVLPHMLTWAGPRTLCRGASVSKHWLESSNIDTLWQTACATRWGSKEVPHIAKRRAISLFPRLRMSAAALGRLSVKELRLIISQMGLDSSACVEKGEMRALVTGGMPRELMGVFRWSYEHDSKWKVRVGRG